MKFFDVMYINTTTLNCAEVVISRMWDWLHWIKLLFNWHKLYYNYKFYDIRFFYFFIMITLIKCYLASKRSKKIKTMDTLIFIISSILYEWIPKHDQKYKHLNKTVFKILPCLSESKTYDSRCDVSYLLIFIIYWLKTYK